MRNDLKIYIGVGILTLLLVVGSVLTLSKMSNPDTSSYFVEDSVLLKDYSHVIGPEDAKVTIVEFSDFQCPACGAVSPAVKNLLATYPDQIKLIYRHFPLDSIHRYARLAAYASESAGEQGKFWEMHDLLFEKQNDWRNANDAKEVFISYAQELELDVEKFTQDIDSDEIKNRVSQDYADGISARVNATPTFFINGQSVLGFGSPDFNQMLENALAD